MQKTKVKTNFFEALIYSIIRKIVEWIITFQKL